MPPERLRVLFVCHANLCRSPMAERLARGIFAGALGEFAGRIALSSAGTHAEPGLPMHPLAAQVLREYGAPGDGFRSRTATAALLDRADLVLTADRGQRAWCVTALPLALSRVFTLRQFGRLAATVDPAGLRGSAPEVRLAGVLADMAAARARLPPATGAEDNLDDPVGGPVEAFRSCADVIRQPLVIMAGLMRP